jgi:hypothetical protein
MRIGYSLLIIAALHVVVGIWLYWPELAAIWADGIVASVEDRGDRATAFWFLVTGVAMLALGAIVAELERSNAALPRALGPSLLALAAAILVPMPSSGAWLILPVAWWAWRSARTQPMAAARL